MTKSKFIFRATKSDNYPVILHWTVDHWPDVCQTWRYGAPTPTMVDRCLQDFRQSLHSLDPIAYVAHADNYGGSNRKDFYGYEDSPSIIWRGNPLPEVKVRWQSGRVYVSSDSYQTTLPDGFRNAFNAQLSEALAIENREAIKQSIAERLIAEAIASIQKESREQLEKWTVLLNHFSNR